MKRTRSKGKLCRNLPKVSTHALQKGIQRCIPFLIAIAAMGLAALAAVAQNDGQEYRILAVHDQKNVSGHLNCWLDLAPDGNTVGLSSTQGFPYRTFPLDREQEVRTMDVGNWYAG